MPKKRRLSPKIEKELKRITKNIVKQYKPDKIILFGSYAWGTPHEDSDVDLFIIKNTAHPRVFAENIDGSIFPRPFPIDILVYTPELFLRGQNNGDFFIHELIDKGHVLYERKMVK